MDDDDESGFGFTGSWAAGMAAAAKEHDDQLKRAQMYAEVVMGRWQTLLTEKLKVDECETLRLIFAHISAAGSHSQALACYYEGQVLAARYTRERRLGEFIPDELVLEEFEDE